MRLKIILIITLLASGLAFGQQPLLRKPKDTAFEKFEPVVAPKSSSLLLKKGDRLAICGDSITEQKMYSRIMEDYLTMCVPELEVTVRQYGWSGERAPGFLGRMTNDCLRFKPTVATTCYGMNDHEYRPYEDRIGQTYRVTSERIVEAFKANHVRFVQGSPGCVGKIPSWVKSATGTVEDLNLSLCRLRNIGIGIAREENVRFADVFWPMFTAGIEGQKRYGADYAIAGKDGVHPGWAGQTVMAYAFLKALGVNGNLGTFIVDLNKNKMRTSAGHELISAKDGEFQIRSARFPFCACLPEGQATSGYPVRGQDEPGKDSSIRSAMTLIPFNEDLNRLTLMARKGPAQRYAVTWGTETKTFSAGELARGVNLAEQFPCNPFCEAFAKVDAAVAAKQAYETKQIKERFHGPGARENLDAIAMQTESERAPLAAAIKSAFAPVTHTIKIVPQ
ncbi:MAG TPA: SGNH/GDSL hydrolase family protein [Verrucomicrobiae bacterium]